MMDYEVILERVINLLAAMTESKDEVTADSELIDDLGISSMDILFLITSLEEEFKIKIPVNAIRKMNTIADVAEIVDELISE